MKKKPAAKPAAVAKSKPGGLAPLIAEVRNLIQSARRGAVSVVNTLQVMTNFEIGRRIVEHEQKGKKRAAYGAALLKELSARLTEEFGQGFSERNLEYMRKFFLMWRSRVPEIEISQQPAAKLEAPGKSRQAPDELTISAQPMRKSPFTLSWTHYVLLLLCQSKKQTVVELTLPKDANIHAKEYQLYLPSKQLLKAKLLEWARAEEARV